MDRVWLGIGEGGGLNREVTAKLLSGRVAQPMCADDART